MATSSNFVGLARDNERYLFIYDNERVSRLALYEVLEQFVGNRLMNLTWSDARLIAQRVIATDREQRCK